MSDVYLWGPCLYRTQISKQDVEYVFELCNKNPNNDFRKNLAGHIKDEYTIDVQKFKQITEKYYTGFAKAYKMYFGKDLNKLEPISAWVNYMKKGEYNPIHTHTKCDYSSVLFIRTPEELKAEGAKMICAGQNNKPGSVNFIYGEALADCQNHHSFYPEEGDFLIFPYWLKHVVNPFQSDIERISVAANFIIK